MIDLHTHLLWDWDDGPDDRPQAREMCRIAEKDGITVIALTPHVFRLSRYGDNLNVLRQRMAEFVEGMDGVPIDFHWGAEVFVHPEVVASIEKYGFTLDDTNYVFIELPSDTVPPGIGNLIYSLMAKGFVPIISHPERNRGFMERPEVLYELVSMGCIAQVTAMSLTGEFGRETRSAAGLFMEHNLVHIIASDAHSSLMRPPVLSGAVEAARKIVGEAKAVAMVTEIPRAILENRALPDWGEPENPLRRKTWAERRPMPRKQFLVKIR
ncbi:MAG: CpsB/CapC family capsule biosynthesis tyrosine phosphatase [Candidatus Aminicenantales bacterium]